MKNYLEWLAQDTPTRWWHDSAIPAEIDAAIANGALGVTTNPVLTYQSLQAVPDFWKPQVDGIPGDLAPALRAEELLRIVASHAASRLEGIYERTEGRHGYALGQLDPSICSDSGKMLAQALRYVSWAREHRRQAAHREGRAAGHRGAGREGDRGLHDTELLRLAGAGRGRGLRAGCRTRQGSGHPGPPLLRGPAGWSPGRVPRETAQDNGIDVAQEDIRNAGNAVCKKAYRLFRERGISATIMPAGLRGVHHLAAMAGADMVFSLQTRVQRLAIEADLPRVERIDEEIPAVVIERLRRIPEFVRAYDEGGLAPKGFVTFGVIQKTLSQFSGQAGSARDLRHTVTSARWF